MNIFDKLEIKTKDWLSCIGDDYDQSVWVAGPKCTRDQWEAAKTALVAEYDAQAYARKREAEYPAIQELVVALYDTDDRAAVDAKRAAVKAKYPKPG